MIKRGAWILEGIGKIRLLVRIAIMEMLYSHSRQTCNVSDFDAIMPG
jgi:hypothetical protein